MRVVTLLPSATEIVHALGATDLLVGVSHCCTYPEVVRHLPVMTSTHIPYREDSETIDGAVRAHLGGNDALYDLDLVALAAAKPDVIISQALCDVCAVSTDEVAAALCILPGNAQMVDLTPNTLADVFDDIRRVGDALGLAVQSSHLVSDLETRLQATTSLSAGIPERERPRVAFLEWLLPLFNGGHWNPELVTAAGGMDVLGRAAQPSTTLEWSAVIESEPDVLVIAIPTTF